jgi:hypothetical protein
MTFSNLNYGNNKVQVKHFNIKMKKLCTFEKVLDLFINRFGLIQKKYFVLVKMFKINLEIVGSVEIKF